MEMNKGLSAALVEAVDVEGRDVPPVCYEPGFAVDAQSRRRPGRARPLQNNLSLLAIVRDGNECAGVSGLVRAKRQEVN